MKHQHSLIIGGESGIGKACCEEAEKRGSVVWAPTREELNVRYDMEFYRYFDSLKQTGVEFENVIYCAGIAQLAWIKDLQTGAVDEVFDVNILGFLRLIRSLVRYQMGGRVCVITSDAGETPMRGSIAYCSSKAALSMAIRVAARELAPAWVVNGVAPIIVGGTPMTEELEKKIAAFRGWTDEEAYRYEMASVPMGRRVTVPEVVDAVFFMLSAPMSNGVIFHLKGGK